MAEVGEQLPALADHLQQPPPGVHVLLVRGEVLGELSDALREQRNLDFRRAGIPVVPLKLAHDLSFHILCQRHTLYPHLTVTHKNRIAEGRRRHGPPSYRHLLYRATTPRDHDARWGMLRGTYPLIPAHTRSISRWPGSICKTGWIDSRWGSLTRATCRLHARPSLAGCTTGPTAGRRL